MRKTNVLHATHLPKKACRMAELRRITGLTLRIALSKAVQATLHEHHDTRDTMPAASRPDRTRCPPDPASLCARAVAARLNPLLNVILAFWAQFHCRHARPPALALA